MKILIVLISAFFVVACASVEKDQRNISGRYYLYIADKESAGVVTTMTVIQDGDKISVEGTPDQMWRGVGVVGKNDGHYDWKFKNGDFGRTTFTIDPEGKLNGHVQGSGLDWKYKAVRNPAN